MEQWQCELQDEDAANAGRMFVDLEGIDEEELNAIESGSRTLYSEFAVIADGTLKIPKGAAKSIERAAKRGPAEKEKSNKGKGIPKNGRNLAPVVTTRRVLAVRIQANDRTTSSSEDIIRDKIFGTYGDEVNLRERFQSCSYGEMLIEPVETQKISGGVFTIRVNTTVNGTGDAVVREATLSALSAALGDLPSQFDHVMLCIPPGTSGSWIGYGKYQGETVLKSWYGG